MRFLKHITFIIVGMILFTACEDRETALGLPEYENHYYAAYIPNNNSKVSVKRNQTTLVKFPVQFYSAFTRDYDAVADYVVNTQGVTNPATLGVDFNIVDKNGAVIQPVDGKYSFTFPQAKRATDTIYVKLLNNPAAGTRNVEINIVEHDAMPEYLVDIFSTAFKRPLEIK